MDKRDQNMPMLTHHALGFERPQKLLDLSLDDDAPQPEPEPVEVDPFIDEIAKVKNSQSPAVKDTIDRATCFGRFWYDDKDGICVEMECDLRSLCELVFTRATGKTPKPEEHHVSPVTSQQIPEQKSKGWHPNLKKQISGNTFARYPYISLGRTSDHIAEEIWRILGNPASLPDVWAYPPTANMADKKVAARNFIDRYGDGLLVCKRQQYHQYFRDGKHLIRLWLGAERGCWIDVTREVAKAAMQHAKILKITLPPSALIKVRYKFYPYRIFATNDNLKHWVKLFSSIGILSLPE